MVVFVVVVVFKVVVVVVVMLETLLEDELVLDLAGVVVELDPVTPPPELERVPVNQISLELAPTYTENVPLGNTQLWLETSQ